MAPAGPAGAIFRRFHSFSARVALPARGRWFWVLRPDDGDRLRTLGGDRGPRHMIKKLQEDWEKLSQEAQASAGDPVRQRAIMERMNAVSGALRKLSQGSVTRTTLSQAVREALERILAESRDTL